MHHGGDDILFPKIVLEESVGVAEIRPLFLPALFLQPVRSAAHKAVLKHHAVLAPPCPGLLNAGQRRGLGAG